MRNRRLCHHRRNSAPHARHPLHQKSPCCAQSRCTRPQKPPENHKRNMLHPCYIYGSRNRVLVTYVSLPTSCTMCTMFRKLSIGLPTSASSPSSSSSSQSLSFVCAASICTFALGDGWRMQHLYVWDRRHDALDTLAPGEGQPVNPRSVRSCPKCTMWGALMFSRSIGNVPAGARPEAREGCQRQRRAA
ncbi:hypothetical protein FB451DRAFT_1294219 [Mycena latifolia]|nr:hypothetical protein FB451DRAFT_1294219 [Mycena latifolia]